MEGTNNKEKSKQYMKNSKKVRISESDLSKIISSAVRNTITEISAGKAFRAYDNATEDAAYSNDDDHINRRRRQANAAMNYGKNRLRDGMAAYQREIVPLFDQLKRKLEEHNNMYLGGEDIEELFSAIDNVREMVENEYEEQSHYGDNDYYRE